MKNNKKRLIASITIFIVILLAGVMYYNNYRNNSSKNDIGIKDNNSKNTTKTSEEKTVPKAQKFQNDNHSGKDERSSSNSTAITGDNAVKLVRNRVKNDEPNASFTFDHIETKDNVEYYVVHAFDSMEDHGATTGWYYVDKSTGKVYEYDLVNNKLISIP